MLSLSRRRRLTGAGAALVVAYGAGTTVVASCGSESGAAGSFGPGFDSGVGETGTDTGAVDGTTDTGFSGDGGDTGAPDAGSAPTTALVVQASPSLPDVRLCWGTAAGMSPTVPFPGTGAMPGSNYPGIPLGGALGMSDATPLEGSIQLYAIDSLNLARIEASQPGLTCKELICGPGSQSAPCLRDNLDYWPVASGKGAVAAHADNVVALAGCLPGALDPAASTARCGAGWSALAGNLHVDVVQLLGIPGAAGTALDVQAAQLSPGLAALVGDGGAAVLSFGPQASQDAGAVALLSGEGQVAAPAFVSVGGGLAGYGQLGFSVDVPGDDGGTGHAWMSLAESQQLVDPTQDPTVFFGQNRPYLVAVLGDPAAPHAFAPTGDAGYDGKGLHLLVVAAPAPAAADGGD